MYVVNTHKYSVPSAIIGSTKKKRKFGKKKNEKFYDL